MQNSRRKIFKKLMAQIHINGHIIAVASGSGMSAKYCTRGGADLILALSAGRFRQTGRASLASFLCFGNSNQIVTDFAARELIPLIQEVPILFGLNASDPTIDLQEYICNIQNLGFSGIVNFPTVGLIDGVFRQNLEETGMGYGLEVEMIRKAHELDMLTCPYVFDPDQARAMAEAGADILVAHMGLTTKGTIGAKTALTLDDCVVKIKDIIKAGREVNPDIMVICHGGPIAEPDDAQYVISRVPEIDGFFGASSIERFAAERGIKAQAAAFKAITK